jgi:hypothetical protein
MTHPSFETSPLGTKFLFAYLRSLRPKDGRPFTTAELLAWVNHFTDTCQSLSVKNSTGKPSHRSPVKQGSEEFLPGWEAPEPPPRRRAEVRFLTLRNLRRAIDAGRQEGKANLYFVLENDQEPGDARKELIGKSMEFTWLDFLRILAWRVSSLAGYEGRMEGAMTEEQCLEIIAFCLETEFAGDMVLVEGRSAGPSDGDKQTLPVAELVRELQLVSGIGREGRGGALPPAGHVELLFSGYQLVSPAPLPQRCIDEVRKALAPYVP